jgi:hypothetical protein
MQRVLLRVRRMLFLLLGVLAAFYVGLCLLVFFHQRSMVYPVPPGAQEPRLPGAALLRIPGPEGSTVFALHVPAPPGAPTVVHFHGNGEQLADSGWLALRFQEAGLGFYAVEYPGYGLAKGRGPTEDGLYAAAEAALKHLEGLGVPREQVVLQGQSLGSGVAVEMARRGYGARLVLVSPYTSMMDMGALLLPWLPVRLLARERFDTVSKAPQVALPVLIVHGTQDELIPVAMGQRLGTVFPRASVFLVEGAGHNDVYDRAPVLQEVLRFVLAR